MKNAVRKLFVTTLAFMTITLGMGGIMHAFGGPPTLSTNPGNHVIFPAKDQTPEQQTQDQLAAYNWASKQTKWDPYEAAGSTGDKAVANQKTADSTKGKAAGGAARGGLLGLAVGAIAGDASEGAAIGAAAGGLTSGMRSHRTRSDAKKSTNQAVGDYNKKFQLWDRNWVAAMEGKGYTIK